VNSSAFTLNEVDMLYSDELDRWITNGE